MADNVISIKEWKHKKIQIEIDNNVRKMVCALMSKAYQLRQAMVTAKTVEESRAMFIERWQLISQAYQQARGNGISIRMSADGKFSVGRRVDK